MHQLAVAILSDHLSRITCMNISDDTHGKTRICDPRGIILRMIWMHQRQTSVLGSACSSVLSGLRSTILFKTHILDTFQEMFSLRDSAFGSQLVYCRYLSTEDCREWPLNSLLGCPSLRYQSESLRKVSDQTSSIHHHFTAWSLGFARLSWC